MKIRLTSFLKSTEDLGFGPGIHSLHLATLFGFAVAQPLLDLIGQHPEFLVAHGIRPLSLFAFVFCLGIGVPLSGWGVLFLLDQISRRVETVTAVFFIVMLSGLMALQVLDQVISAPSPLLITEAVGVGLGLGWAYSSLPRLRYFLTVLSPSILVFLVVFLFRSPLLHRENEFEEMPHGKSLTPVVMVILDELPSISLLGEDGKIDPVRYPNLATLSKEAHWFKNASTVSEGTLISIPSILNGLYPEPGKVLLPTWANHPRSLFSILKDSHHLNIHENITQLAPFQMPNNNLDLFMFLSDLRLLYLHLLLPHDLSSQLVPITESWKNFSFGPDSEPTKWENLKADWSVRGEQFRDFIQSIQNTDKPGFHFLHSMLPHASWKYLPDGRMYALFEKAGVAGVLGPNNKGRDVNQWLEDEWLVIQAYKRHLLQVSYVDKLVGELVSHLKKKNLYEQSLIVLTSDHGTAFLSGNSRRRITPSNHPGVISIPLIVKEPFQTQGFTSDRNVETIDILPTMLELLEIDISWDLDGVSALESLPERPFKVAYSDNGKRFTFDARLPEREQLLKRKLDLFGSGQWSTLFEAGPYPILVGKQLSSLRIGNSRIEDPFFDLNGSHFFRNVDLNSPFLLCLIRGTLDFRYKHENVGPFQLAVAVNGVIRGTTQTSPVLNENSVFTGMVNPTSFVNGLNLVEVFLIEGSKKRPHIRRLQQKDRPLFLEETKRGKEHLVYGNGDSKSVQKGIIKGWVVGGKTEIPNQYFVGGWVVNQQKRSLVSSVLVLVNEEVVATGITQFERTEAVEMFKNQSLLSSGFRLEFQLSEEVLQQAPKVRVMAVSSDVVGELNYPQNNQFWTFGSETLAIDFFPVYTWGEILTYGNKGSILPYLKEGWADPQEGVHWSVGNRAALHFQVDKTKGPIILEASLKPFLIPGQLEAQRIQIYANGFRVGDWLAFKDDFEVYRLEIAEEHVSQVVDLTIEFRTPDSASPVSLGIGSDVRSLGLALSWIRLKKIS